MFERIKLFFSALPLIPKITTFVIYTGCFLSSYLIGSIPIGYWFAKLFFKKDIRQIGSGNSGATNIGRTFGVPYFFLILLLDAGKAFACVYAIDTYIGHLPLLPISHFNLISLSALGLLIGNRFSCFMSFHGGKGVATSLGIMMALLPFSISCSFAICWLAVLAVFKKPYIASIFSMCFVPLLTFFIDPSTFFEYVLLFIGLCLWIFISHQENIKKDLHRTSFK